MSDAYSPEQDPLSYQAPRNKEILNKKVKGNIGDFAMGAGNQLLFGIPEAIIRKTGLAKGEDIDKYKAENDLFQSGEVGGAVGSGFVPLAGIAGRAGKILTSGAKAGDKVAGLLKTGTVQGLKGAQALETAASQGMKGAMATNAANAVLGEAIREGASGNFSPERLGTAGLFGAGGAALTRGLSKLVGGEGSTTASALSREGAVGGSKAGGYLEKGMKRPPKHIVEAAEQKLSTYGPLNPHQESLMNPSISKIQSPAGQAAAADSYVVNAAHVAQKYDIKPGDGASMDAAIAANQAKYQQLDEITTPLVPKLQEKFDSQEMADKASEIIGNIPSSKSGITNAVMKNYNDMVDDVVAATTPKAMRDAINNHLGIYYKQAGSAIDQNVVDSSIRIGRMLQDELKGEFSAAAIAAGKPQLAATPMENGIIKDIGSQMLMKKFSGQGGSTIPLSMAMSNFVTGNSSVRSLLAATAGQTVMRGPANAIKQATINATGSRFGKLMSKEGTPVTPVSQEIGGNAPSVAPEGPSKAPGFIQRARNVVSDQILTHGGSAIAGKAVGPSNSAETEAPQTPQTTGGKPDQQSPQVQQLIDKRASEIWNQKFLNEAYGEAGPDNPNFTAFAERINKNLSGTSGAIDARLLGNYLFQSPQDRQLFPVAYDAYRSIFPNIEAAFESSKGIPGVANTVGQIPVIGGIANEANLQVSRGMNQISQDETSKAARASIIAGIRQLAQFGGKDPEDAGHTAEQIIATSQSPKQMEDRLMQYFATANSSGYEILKKAGIIQ